ncbi:DUF1415 domain-containing protein [Oceanobacter sp. 5_MG-2023]|uniref:DUF1415 domain-containing protein n=1 Tax=Oceanobacter sp. 5_MG-2023 TaxID=3062645 RepID=UPI0026E2288C|nr:DUF1415 domain-containing protein [Oceanobacter sp. 5_MG-2023]MDO6683403.1 DUF1415 domain-containing protein [Oceanobacter sp. 5_MG-2023]
MMDAATLTRHWVETLVIGEGLCPFAAPVMPALRIDICEHPDLDQATAEFMDLLTEVARADSETLPTALFVVPGLVKEFDEYWNWSLICEQLLVQMGYEGLLQLATFHPNYCFDGEPLDDPGNFTNRSPFPMLHIIREAHIEQALASVPFPERIPERNQKHLRRLGIAGVLALMPELANTEVLSDQPSAQGWRPK